MGFINSDMSQYVWVLRQNGTSEVPIGAQILARINSRIKIKDDNNDEYWISSEEILRPMHPTSILGVEDMISLGELQEYSILRNLEIRYKKDFIYTYIGSILVAVNPYKPLPIYNETTISEYRKKRLGELPPHIFAVADHSYENMQKMSEKRCIVISGESGAGKTESTKLFLKYFATISHRLSGKEQQILDSNPILEAFGNAKTVCNDNSSRFGKYISINFNTDGSVLSAQIKQYLLEKSRIVSQNTGEQNYHIFYAVLIGLTPEEKRNLDLKAVSSYNYLNGVPVNALLDNETSKNYDLKVIKSAMKGLSFSDLEIWKIFELIAAILHFGNVEFEEVPVSNLESVSNINPNQIQKICSLLRVTTRHLVDSLTKKTISTHDDNVVKFLSKQEAINARDAFVKKIFGNLFNFIVEKINQVLVSEEKNSSRQIGILDIFGFEAFDRNSFEQLCINYASERLQQFFVGHVFKIEQEQYATEGINWKFVDYPDNEEILDLIETGPKSILSVINDATKIPKGTDETMLDKLIEFHHENPFFFKPKYKNTPVFGIQHFAGVVLYDTKDFVEKNHDACSLDIKQVVHQSKNEFLKQIFANDFEIDHNSYFKKRLETLISKFKSSLDLLMNELNECQPFFVRCIKPNDFKKPQKFDRMLCCKQLKYSGMTEVTKIREAGYPVRYDFVQFVQQYRILVPGIPLAHKTACKDATLRICRSAFKNLPQPNYQLGHTKIFLKHKEELFLEAEREKALYFYAVTIQKFVRGWLARRRLLKLKKAVTLTEKHWTEKQQRIQGNKIRNGFYRLEAKLKSRQLNLEFQRYRHLAIRLQALCRGYLIRNFIKKKLEQKYLNNPTETETSSQTPNESADFKEFARKHFQDKHSHRYTKKPIKSSLTRLVHPVEKIAAKALWTTILRYTGNISEPQIGVTKVSVASQLRGILRTIRRDSEKVDDLKKVNRLYENWLKTKTTRIQKLYFIIGHGIERPELRDEIYCQICKILTKNPSKKASHHGWDLISSCTGCFPPSDLFLKYLKSFIREGQQKCVSSCLFRLHRTIQNGSRTQPPSTTEFQAIKRQKPLSVEVFLTNGASTLVKIDSATTAKEMLDVIAKTIRLTDTFGFSLVLVQEMRRLSLGDGSSFVLDAVSECEQYIMETGGSFDNVPWKIFLKKEMFAPWHEFSADEVSNDLIYHQIREGIITGEYGFDEKDLPNLIANICYAEGGKLQSSALNDAVDRFLPHYIRSLSLEDLECVKGQVKAAYQRKFGKNQKPINSVRTEIVQHAASNWEVEFSRFFNVTGSIRNALFIQPYPEVPLVVGINATGIYVIDESNEKRLIAKMDYMEIREITRKEVAENQGYVLKIINYAGMEISLVFRSNLDNDLRKLLNTIIETLKKYSKFVISIKNFKAQDESFLELQKGDLIILSENFSGKNLLQTSFAKGFNERSGKTGNLIHDCVEIIPTVKKPPEPVLKPMREEILCGKKTQFGQLTERLKHYSLESYANKYFRTDETHEVNGEPLDLWKYSAEKIQRPLHAKLVNKVEEAKLALEIFNAILRYSENNEELDFEEDLTRRIFGPGLENDELKDETYCQIMKQLTSNMNKSNENKAWELMWMITGLYSCGEILEPEVKKFLQSRRTMHVARESLTRFYKILTSATRKHPPHLIEIEAVKNRPCHMFHRVYFPDDTHKFFQLNSTTTVKELKDSILNRLNINILRKGFHLYLQFMGRLFLIPDDYYIFDYLQIFRKWTEKNKVSKIKWEYKICFMKHTWKTSNSLSDKITYLKFLFPQEYNKYIEGHYEIPEEDLIQLAALLYKTNSFNKPTQQFQKILQKLIPQKAMNLMKTEVWQSKIQETCNGISSTSEDCKVKFLRHLNKLSCKNLPYFAVIQETSNLANYIFYPVTSHSRSIV